jgi:hypothetical protein
MNQTKTNQPSLMISDGRSVWHCELSNGHRFCATTLDDARRIARRDLNMGEAEVLDEEITVCAETSEAIQGIRTEGSAEAARSLPFCISDISDLTGWPPLEILSLIGS